MLCGLNVIMQAQARRINFCMSKQMEWLPLSKIFPPLQVGELILYKHEPTKLYSIVHERGQLIARSGPNNRQTVATSTDYAWARKYPSKPNSVNLDDFM